MHNIKRALYILQEDGLSHLLYKIKCYIGAYISRIQNFLTKSKIYQDLDKIFEENEYDFIDLFIFNFGWNVPLYQRPQHIAVEMSNMKGLVLYASNPSIDGNVKNILKVKKNLYLINLSDPLILNYIFKKLNTVRKKKLLHTYASDMHISLQDIIKYEKMGFDILYEYVDEISDEIFRIKVPKEQYEKHNWILKNPNYYIVTSAEKLAKEVVRMRGNHNHILVTNGVDYNHWKKKFNVEQIPEDLKNILKEKKTVVGYFGALATWFDYKLVEALAKARPYYQIILIGAKHDSSYEKSFLGRYPNINYLGQIDYKILNQYAYWFDVCMIPFIVNEVTKSTSPIKLFEYMALGKPIVTTALPECKKYQSVLVAENYEEFINKIDLAIGKKTDNTYMQILQKEALENTWVKKVKCIIQEFELY